MTAAAATESAGHRGVGGGLEIRLLGPVEVVDATGATQHLGTRKQRALLTILALARGQTVSADRIVDELWGDEPPARAMTSLYSYVSNLRRLLEPQRDTPPTVLVTSPPGYSLRLPSGAVDVVRFEQAAERVSSLLAAASWSEAQRAAEQALAMWRGAALGEFAAEPYAELDALRLDEMRVSVLESLLESRLEQHDAHLVADVERFTSEHPLRERGWAILMRALYAAGRQSDALRAYQRARTRLLDELGVEPGPGLRDLEAAILRHDDSLSLRHDDTGRTPVIHDDDGHDDAGSDAVSPTGRDAAVTSTLPLIGREAELATCRSLLDELDQGPRALIIEGDAGIGKTRLVEELAAVADARGMLVLWGRAFEGATAPSFWPWLPPLRHLVGVDGREHLVPAELTALLSSSPSTTSRPPESARFTLFDAIGALLERVAERQQLVIVLDDLQWADIASLELVVTLATRLTRPGLLLVTTVRELEVGRNDVLVAALAALTRMAGSRRFRLSGLVPDETIELLRAVAGDEIDPRVAAAVLRRAEGNPFFTTELGRLLDSPPGGTHAGADPGSDIPSGVRDVVLRRLDPMPAPTLELLRVAAVIGREFEGDLLTRATGRPELLDCLETLEPAVLQRLVVHVDERPGTYRFVHAIVREVLLDDVAPLHLARAHLQVADALAVNDDTVNDDTVEIVAEHLWAASPLGVGRRAAVSLEQAARVALARSAYERAQSLLERAADLYGAASAGSPADDDAELRVLTLLAAVGVAHGGFIANNDSPLMARARRLTAASSDAHQATLRWLDFSSKLVLCDFPVADELAHELLAGAETTDHPLVRAVGHAAFAASCWYHGRLDQAVAHYERTQRDVGDAARFIGDTPVNAVHLHLVEPVLAHIRELMGALDDPIERFAEARRTMPDDPLWNLTVSLFASLSALMVGDPERAAREATVGIAADPHESFGPWSAGPRICHAAAIAIGEPGEGERLLDGMADSYVVGTQRTTVSIVFAGAALGLADAGRLDRAAQAATMARVEIGSHRDLYTEPYVLLAEAVVAARRGDAAGDVSRHLNQALTMAERQGARAVAAHVRARASGLGVPMEPSPAVAAR